MRRLRRTGLVLATAAVAGLAIAALLAAHRHPGQSVGGGAAPALALQLTAAIAAAVAGAQLARRRATPVAGALLVAIGAAVSLGQLPLPQSGDASLFTAALAGGAMTSALAGAAALAARRSRWRRIDAVVVGAALASSGLLLGLAATATFDPRATGCFECPRNLLLVHGDAQLHDALVRAGLVAAAATAAALGLLVALEIAVRPVVLRAAGGPLIAGGGAAAIVGAIAFVHESRAGQPTVDATTRALWLAQCGLVCSMAAGVAARTWRARLLRRRVAALVLGALPSPETLRAALARTLGDPGLEVVFPRGDGATLDADGRQAGAADRDAAVTQVLRRGEVVAELRHAAALAQAPERVAQAALGAGLALEHASWHARLQAELADLTASRARIVEVGDAERRRLERNLHDGAQQRLIALSLALRLGSHPDAELQRAGEELQGALDNLRSIAHGIHPVALSEAGLAEAVRDLAQNSRVPLRITAPPGRLPPSVEAALYRLVLDCVRLAERSGHGRAVDVTIETAVGLVRARIVVPGAAAGAALALDYAGDRLAAVCGELSSTSDGDDMVVEGSVPCAS